MDNTLLIALHTQNKRTMQLLSCMLADNSAVIQNRRKFREVLTPPIVIPSMRATKGFL